MNIIKYCIFFICGLMTCQLNGQEFYFGADMSYVNEMEDCGVVYKEAQKAKDPFTIFKDHNCNLVRLRLWHSPKWYDELNNGQRYSDFQDVQRSIRRAKDNGMSVLLDFHLSDNWADPSKQLVPDAWLSVVDNTDLLKDSLYNYIYRSLTKLKNLDLLPEMIQIGNETNKGILLSPVDNQVYTLNWSRNAILFNSAIQAVRDFENDHIEEVEIVLHIAGPEDAEWLMAQFISNGVTNFDVIGLSYYWAWHMPASITDLGDLIVTFRSLYPDKEVIVVETGYIWTTESNDTAGNIISDAHSDYLPISPVNQKAWLVDLTKKVIASDGKGVIYWEPCWVSSSCFTQWGQGSHQEHATFFDFDNNLLQGGGIDWMTFDYGLVNSVETNHDEASIRILSDGSTGRVLVKQLSNQLEDLLIQVIDTTGKLVMVERSNLLETAIDLSKMAQGTYVVTVLIGQERIASKKVIYQ